MKTASKFLVTALASLSLAMLAGCSVANHQESVGEYVDGSVITAKVKSAIAEDLGADAAASISVKTIQGDVVQLSGFTKTSGEKFRAGETARLTEGVKEVHNALVVVP